MQKVAPILDIFITVQDSEISHSPLLEDELVDSWGIGLRSHGQPRLESCS